MEHGASVVMTGLRRARVSIPTQWPSARTAIFSSLILGTTVSERSMLEPASLQHLQEPARRDSGETAARQRARCCPTPQPLQWAQQESSTSQIPTTTG